MVALAVVAVLACGNRSTRGPDRLEPALEVEDVSLPVDAELSIEADVKGKPVVSGVAGVLPSDYPRDLPTHEPASIVDFGAAVGGWSFVEFDTPTFRDRVVTSLEEQLSRAGWRVETVAPGRLKASRGDIEIRFDVSDMRPGSRIRVEYR